MSSGTAKHVARDAMSSLIRIGEPIAAERGTRRALMGSSRRAREAFAKADMHPD